MRSAIGEAERAEFRVEGEWTQARRHRIRWSECDMHAHVNHTAYLVLFEDLRVAWWLSVGGRFGPGEPGPAVIHFDVRYLKAAGFGDEVLLTQRTPSFRRSSFVHEYGMWRRGDGLVCSARAVCVLVRSGSGEKAAIPPEIRRALLERDGAREEGGG
ncbi:acyl-CoA thioesterase [Caldovatus aquaticus]|uniref:Acyl-CoA thioesterase n=1 Tax=Caldovatus aquaticus TaxID=2865671 RepID=A0ABS7F1S7_9PROT|nr:acyl-CoA thioesterase [Caldovatus aquaticus]MBW8268761.1 acyl-CoA thioesterase [Caldovatus aquaticus]